MSQKDLAQKVNEKPSVIQEYEASRAIPNPQILAKLERALGVKLRGMCVSVHTASCLISHRPLRRLEHWRQVGGPKEVVGWPLHINLRQIVA